MLKKGNEKDLLIVEFIIINWKLESMFAFWCINYNFENASVFVVSCILCLVNYLMTSQSKVGARNLNLL